MIKQIVNNWQLELILLLGLVLAVGVFSSIPIYTEGSLQFSLVRHWERSSSSQSPPGVVHIANDQWRDYHAILSGATWRDQAEAWAEFKRLDTMFKRDIPARFGTELLHQVQTGRIERKWVQPVIADGYNQRRYLDIRYVSGLEDRITIVDGRWPDEDHGIRDETIEVVIDETARDTLNIMVDRVYIYPLTVADGEERRHLHIKVVGVFRVNQEDLNRPVWISRPPFEQTFFVTEGLFAELVQRDDTQPNGYDWYFVFDHDSVRVNQLMNIVTGLRTVQSRAEQTAKNVRYVRSPSNTLSSFMSRADILQKLLLILSLPVMGMILYYVMLAASLTIRRRRNEIAMLKSRGAGVTQILLIFTLEWGILCLLAIGIGPYLGIFIARVMGASAGFLSFVGRAPLPVELSSNTYRYAIVAAVVALISCLFQVIPAARHSIVSYKQDIGRGGSLPIWQRFYLDYILLGFSVYGYRMLLQQIRALNTGTAQVSDLLLDPMLFLVPVLFLVAAGLLVLRIVPWVIRFLAWSTQRLPDVSLVMTLRQFSRDPGRYTPLMFFIILTVALGIYGASIARTIDYNYVDSIMYGAGSDVVLQSRWSVSSGYYGSDMDDEYQPEPVEVTEPPFYIHKELPGVIDAARVMRYRGTFGSTQGTMIGIDPVDFANVSWFRKDLADHHLNNYLNMLIMHEEAALVSPDVFTAGNLNLGDWVQIRVGSQNIDFFVAGVVDYWPSVQPRDYPFIIVNLDYVQSQYIIEPYQVWLRLAPGAQLAPMVEILREEGIWVTNIVDTRSQIIQGRRDPQRMGLFGMLTIVFVVSVLITVIGFLLYSFLSLKDRMLQFGVLRAIGLSFPQLLIMLSLEQLLSVGLALVLGTLFGAIASYIFIPFMQVTQGVAGVIPPFLVVVQNEDIIRIFMMLGITLFIGLIGLGVALAKMKLNQAIKLGEEV